MTAAILFIAAQATLGTLTPFVTADGEQLFTYVAQPDATAEEIGREKWVNDRLARLLAAERWCLDGWEITSLQESSGYIVVEGRCRDGEQ